MPDRKVFHDSIVPIPIEAGPAPGGLVVNAAAAAAHGSEKMPLHFSLALSNDVQKQLEDAVAEGRVVSPDDLQSKYAAEESDTKALVAWLKDNGFTIDQVTADHASVYATAPVDVVSKALDVKMARVTIDGLTYTAARTPPSLPADVAGSVQAIIGLQPYRRAHKHLRKRQRFDSNRLSSDSQSSQPVANVANKAPYLPGEVLRAYGGELLGLTGQNETIAILIDTFPDDADLLKFWNDANVPGAIQRIQKINVKGQPLPQPEGEETLDVEWASGIAPNATIRIYATGSLSFVDLDRALDQIVADLSQQTSMRQLSISLGLGESYLNGPGGEVAIEHQKFLKLAAAGVNVFVSSGDAGSNPDQTGHGSDGPLQVEYQSSDPYVISVGGTTLKLAADGTVASESGWANGGGGKSVYFPRPSWQTAPGINGASRLVPDVSATADPEEGALLVLNGKPIQIGGTSWSAPIWAGFCALLNEARTKNGQDRLGFLNPLLYPLRASCFRDIVDGTNGAYQAMAGYDLVTGLGVPQLEALAAALAGIPVGT